MNFAQFKRELNSASFFFLFLIRWRIFHKKNVNFMKGEFVCKNEIFLIFQFLLPFRRKFSIWICGAVKDNYILHLLLFFFYFDNEFFIRKILILWKVNSSARMNFFLFFSFFCHSDLNSPSELVTVWKRIQFNICSISSSTLKMNFS